MTDRDLALWAVRILRAFARGPATRHALDVIRDEVLNGESR